jgi:hypothetical protein
MKPKTDAFAMHVFRLITASVCCAGLIMLPTSATAFQYDKYDHFSFANCSVERDGGASINCDVPNSDGKRWPTKMSRITVYTRDFSGWVQVCARHVAEGLTLCAYKYAQPDATVNFDTHDLNFNWDSVRRWGGEPQWWNWVVFVSLWGADMDPDQALNGYKVFYDTK